MMRNATQWQYSTGSDGELARVHSGSAVEDVHSGHVHSGHATAKVHSGHSRS
jgi:hypothetical protein